MTVPDFSNADEDAQARCRAVAKVEGQRYLCELPAGHTVAHRNGIAKVAWDDNDPLDDTAASRAFYANP